MRNMLLLSINISLFKIVSNYLHAYITNGPSCEFRHWVFFETKDVDNEGVFCVEERQGMEVHRLVLLASQCNDDIRN